MQKQTPRPGQIGILVGFVLSCFGLLIFLWTTFGGPIPFKPEGYRFTASYEDASQLAVQADVRISGVSVGKVVELRQEGGVTKAEVEMDDRFAPVPTDTETILRLKTLLGETYIELTPGTPPERGGQMLAEDGELPPGQTEKTVELDEVLRGLDRRTRDDLKVFLAELSTAVEKRGRDLNAAIGNFGPAVDEGATLARVLRTQRRAVRQLVRDSGTVLGAVSERRGALRSLVDGGSRVLEATARRNAELTETVHILPTFLDELRSTLAVAEDVGREADPLLDELAPASLRLTPTIRDLRAAAPRIDGLFRDLGPVVRRGRRGVPALRTILNEARPLVGQLHPTLIDAVPVVEWAALHDRELATWPLKLGTATQATAGQGENRRHVLRVVIPVTQEAFAAYPTRLSSNRHNPYAMPDYLDRVGRPHLNAFDCENTSGSDPDAPPCVPQGRFDFRGSQTFFPQLREDPGP